MNRPAPPAMRETKYLYEDDIYKESEKNKLSQSQHADLLLKTANNRAHLRNKSKEAEDVTYLSSNWSKESRTRKIEGMENENSKEKESRNQSDDTKLVDVFFFHHSNPFQKRKHFEQEQTQNQEQLVKKTLETHIQPLKAPIPPESSSLSEKPAQPTLTKMNKYNNIENYDKYASTEDVLKKETQNSAKKTVELLESKPPKRASIERKQKEGSEGIVEGVKECKPNEQNGLVERNRKTEENMSLNKEMALDENVFIQNKQKPTALHQDLSPIQPPHNLNNSTSSRDSSEKNYSLNSMNSSLNPIENQNHPKEREREQPSNANARKDQEKSEIRKDGSNCFSYEDDIKMYKRLKEFRLKKEQKEREDEEIKKDLQRELNRELSRQTKQMNKKHPKEIQRDDGKRINKFNAFKNINKIKGVPPPKISKLNKSCDVIGSRQNKVNLIQQVILV